MVLTWLTFGSRRNLARGRPDHALWLKLVDPEDLEQEQFEVYEKNLTADS
jgi:hypothetical protein